MTYNYILHNHNFLALCRYIAEGTIIVYLTENNTYIIVPILGESFNIYPVISLDNYHLIATKSNNVIALFSFGHTM